MEEMRIVSTACRGEFSRHKEQNRKKKAGGQEIETYLENLGFLQDELLSLKVISGQHDDLLNRSLVCGPQRTHVSYTPTASQHSTAPLDSHFIFSATFNRG